MASFLQQVAVSAARRQLEAHGVLVVSEDAEAGTLMVEAEKCSDGAASIELETVEVHNIRAWLGY